MGDVKAWPKVAGSAVDAPRRIKRPCDYGLESAWMNLETQLGTIEGYNRLVAIAERVKAQIDAGEAKPQNPIYAVSTGAVTSKRKA